MCNNDSCHREEEAGHPGFWECVELGGEGWGFAKYRGCLFGQKMVEIEAGVGEEDGRG